MPNQQLVADLADQLWEAGQARAPIEPLTDRHPELEVDDGYAIQTRNIERRVAAGAHIRGRKIGLTSRAMQELLGVTEPAYGVLLDDMFVEDGDEIPLETMVQPRVEAEAEPERRTRPDVQAALTVVARRDIRRDVQPINLTYAT